LERLENRTLPSSYTAASVSDLVADINAANAAGGSNTITLATKTKFTRTDVNNTTDEALARLELHKPLQAKLVKLRFFTGLTMAETAAALEISTATADRYWTYARAWLQREMARLDP
jgi:DNA-directed RNA polymerase specialized sigma24 family protein